MADTNGTLDLKAIVAMGIGGMVGGGIFSVLGLAMGISGHAAPIVFAIGGVIALFTGRSYAKLGQTFHSAGGSFTYLEHAFTHHNVAGIAGWLLLGGYVGTLALYAYTFGAYGSAMLGGEAGHHEVMHHLLASAVMLIFLAINLYSVAATRSSEVLIVIIKVAILLLFGVVGVFYVRGDYIFPVFNKGASGAVIAASLIFVAYQGFELIPNSVQDMKNPKRDLGRGIMISILAALTIYILVAFVAVGNLTADQVSEHGEYALAVAAQPFLGRGGFILISLAALLSTASAINATLFGTARLGMVMAQEQDLPKAFSFKERRADIPWISLTAITGLTLVLVNLTDLRVISSFASSIFLLIFASINFSAFRLRKTIGSGAIMPLVGCVLATAALGVLFWHLYQTARHSLWIIGGLYVATTVAELLFSKRRRLCKSPPT